MDKNVTLKTYVVGFILSLLLTLGAYLSVVNNLFDGDILVMVILGFALIQLIVQLIFFLHLGSRKSSWNLLIFISTVSIILVIIMASIWIMNNLNYNMTPQDMSDYMIHDEGISK